METASYKFGMGCDPEIFLVDRKAMRYTSAHDLIPGTKDAPHPLINGAVQVDGLAMEYNTKPAYTSAEFAQYNTDVMQQLRKLVPEHIEFSFLPAVRFDPIFFEMLPDDPKELGCNPDFNAFSGGMNPRPSPKKENETMRTGSGHLHISWTEGVDPMDVSHQWDCRYVVQCLEYVLGPYLKLWDKD